jgi:hypothetical protein
VFLSIQSDPIVAGFVAAGQGTQVLAHRAAVTVPTDQGKLWFK